MKKYQRSIPRPTFWPTGTVCLADAVDIVFARTLRADPRLYLRRKLADGRLIAELNSDEGDRSPIPAHYWGGPAADRAFQEPYVEINGKHGAVVFDQASLVDGINEWITADKLQIPKRLTEAERVALRAAKQSGRRALDQSAVEPTKQDQSTRFDLHTLATMPTDELRKLIDSGSQRHNVTAGSEKRAKQEALRRFLLEIRAEIGDGEKPKELELRARANAALGFTISRPIWDSVFDCEFSDLKRKRGKPAARDP
jgi:hypothetical protein